ncbi:uncharacterized protein [Dendropsophus ebraccatus]|uniref:uncharacterized protein n=1 Tax=Dendropsophus ebraccatus TaxID=150705 RepID=UPI003831E624
MSESSGRRDRGRHERSSKSSRDRDTASDRSHRKRSSKHHHKECGECGNLLPDDYSRSLCQYCVDKLVAQEASSLADNLKQVVRDEVQLSLRNLGFDRPAAETPLIAPGFSVTSEPPIAPSEDQEEGEVYLISSNEDQEQPSTSRALCPTEDTEQLIKAIRSSMNIVEEEVTVSPEDALYEGLAPKKMHNFSVHKSIKALIDNEWQNPDRKFFIPRYYKRKYPFEEGECSSWNKASAIDAPVAKIARKNSLPFDDLGSLSDPMDRKSDYFSKRTWEAATGALRTSIAATCVARPLRMWLTKLKTQLTNDQDTTKVLDDLPVISKAVDFLADASTDTIKMSARAAALSNSARRALQGLKAWKGDVAAKGKLCGIPCNGDLLFGPVLDSLLEKASDKKKFPAPPKQQESFRGRRQTRRSFRPNQDNRKFRVPGKGRGFLFNSKDDKPKPPQQ